MSNRSRLSVDIDQAIATAIGDDASADAREAINAAREAIKPVLVTVRAIEGLVRDIADIRGSHEEHQQRAVRLVD